MKYESNILKRLIDTYGVVGNPRYLSEIIKEFIVRGKELYPQLFTYQADWLAHIDEFGLTPEYVVSYTGQQIYAPHTKERPVKRAILKGQTLVNLFQDMDYVWNNLTKQDSFNYNGDLIILNNGYHDGRYWNDVPKIPNIKSNTEYTMIFTKGSSPYVEFGTIDENGNDSVLKRYTNAQKVKITSPNNGDVRVKFCIENPTSDKSAINLGKVMFIEGDYTNVDIPYFEGMQSVKMPVLTTTGKNLFDKEAFYNDWKSKEETYMYKETVDGEEVLKVNNMNLLFADNKGFKISVKKGVPLTMSFKCKKAGTSDTKAVFSVRFSDTAFKDIGKCESYEWIQSSGTFTPTRDYITVCSAYEKNDYYYVKDIQLEYDTQLTTYEPFKSNILTVNEDVTLRSNGDVCDELDLLTGKLTQRIDEDGEVLVQEVVKTVDLTVKDQNDIEVSQLSSFNGGTHFSTSSQSGSLNPMLEVDVVTDLEETLNLCSMDGNTL